MSYEYQTGQPSSAEGSTTDTAKQQASGVAQSAAQSGQHLAGEAKTQAAEVGREAGRQAKGVLEQGREQVGQTASAQQGKLAGGLRSFSQELESMASGESPSEPGMASDVARQVSQRVDALAQWVENKEPAELLQDVKYFARSRPGTFLAIAAGLGLVVGRATRGARDASKQDDEGQYAGAPERTSAYGSTGTTYGTGAAYGTGTSTATGAAYAAGTGSAMTGGETTTSSLAGTSGGVPLAGVEQGSTYGSGSTYATEGSTEDTIAYSTGGADTRAYSGPDSYGTGTENPPGTGYGDGDDVGAYGGGTTEVPAHRADDELTWPPVNGEGDQR